MRAAVLHRNLRWCGEKDGVGVVDVEVAMLAAHIALRYD